MKDFILYVLIGLVITGFLYVLIFFVFAEGKRTAFDSIIMEECWLNKESRDIECIERIRE